MLDVMRYEGRERWGNKGYLVMGYELWVMSGGIWSLVWVFKVEMTNFQLKHCPVGVFK
jgi:hypothetical protein